MRSFSLSDKVGIGFFILAFVLMGAAARVGWNQNFTVDRLQRENDALRREQRCAPVQVTCECPAYEEGWDDAEYASSYTPPFFDEEALLTICEEIESHHQIPGC